MQAKFSRVFYDVEDLCNFCYFNDLYSVIEYRDLINGTQTTRATRNGLVSNNTIIWDDDYQTPYEGMFDVRPVYRARLNCKLDNAFKGIV